MLKNKKILFLTSLCTLLPILFGLVFWNKLPAELPTHWNAAGEVDGWSSKGFAVFGLPFFLLFIHWVCILATRADPKYSGQNNKLLGLVIWICPVVSILGGVLTYAGAFGIDLNVEVIIPALIGIVFLVVGNYLPKCKQNYTIGIKLPWTLHDEENWNKTHRLAGKLWVCGGILILLSIPFQVFWIIFAIALVMVFVPLLYSWLMYRKKMQD